MLQYITCEKSRFTIVEQVKDAIKGGCKWVQLRVGGSNGEGRRAEMLKAAEELMPICHEHQVFLILDNEPELALEAKCNGVHINHGGMSPREAREKLGAGAVIGITAVSAEEVIAAARYDIDYASIDTVSPEEIKKIVDKVKEAGAKIPVVAAGDDVDLQNAPALMAAGASGVAVSKAAAESDNITAYIQSMLKED